MKRKTLNIDGKEIYLTITRYESNNRLAILAETKEEYYCDVTVNLPECNLDIETMVAIDSDCKNSGLEEKLIKEGIIDCVLYTMPYNFGEYDIAFMNLEKLYEYDPEGFTKNLGDKFLIVSNDELEVE